MHKPLRISLILGATLLTLVRASAEPMTDGELDSLLDEGRWAQAEDRAREAVASDPDATALLHLGRVLFASGRTDQLEEALTCLERSTDLDPDQPSAWYWLGRARGQAAGQGSMVERAQSARQAGTCLTRALELDPGCFAYAWALVQYHLQVPGLLGGDRSAAGSVASGFIERQPGEQDLLAAAVALKAGDFARVLDLLRSVDETPDEAMILAWKSTATETGESLLRKEEWTDASALFLLVTERFPEENGDWIGLARAREGQGDPEGAARAYARYLEKAPDSPRTEAIRERMDELID